MTYAADCVWWNFSVLNSAWRKIRNKIAILKSATGIPPVSTKLVDFQTDRLLHLSKDNQLTFRLKQIATTFIGRGPQKELPSNPSKTFSTFSQT